MESETIPPEWAEKIYDMLMEECGAPDTWRENFIQSAGEGCREFRFSGSLGFGGKFYNCHNEWRVDCYSEDMNRDRRDQIKMANMRLRTMRYGHETACRIASLTRHVANLETAIRQLRSAAFRPVRSEADTQRRAEWDAETETIIESAKVADWNRTPSPSPRNVT